MFQDFNFKNLIQNIRTSCDHVVLFSSWFLFTIFWKLTNYIICKDAAFDSPKDLRNDRRTTGEKWEMSPLFLAGLPSNGKRSHVHTSAHA